jgi:hypothetical protein
LAYVPLKQRPKWEATLVTLPNPLSSDVAKWLAEFTGLCVETEAVEIVPVWPPLTVKATAGFIEAMPKTDVFLYAGRITRGGRFGAKALFARSGNQTIAQNSSGASDSFFHLRPEEASVVELTCPDIAPTQLTADFVFKENLVPVSGPELVINENGGSLNRIALYSREANAQLTKIRLEPITSFYLALPRGLKGDLLVDSGKGWEKCLTLQGTGGVAAHDENFKLLPQPDAEELGKALHNRCLSVLLDFGAFGFTKSDALLPHSVTEEIRLPTSLRQRIMTYLCQTRKRPIAPLSARSMKDKVLIGAFLRCGADHADGATWRTLRRALVDHFEPAVVERILRAK